jgi:Concanavalin A-like lectin/glucanases superfamily/Calcineurin-like phosphoesterase
LFSKRYRTVDILLFSFLLISIIGIIEGSFFIPNASAQGTFPNFNFAAVGDWDCGSNAVATRNSIINNNPELVVGLGDYSYEANADCWLNIVDPFDDKMKIAIGNHEIDESSQSLGQYLNHFNMPTQYHSFNHQNVHFLVLATDDTFGLNSNQYQFAVSDLQTASSNPNIDWIVVAFHKPFYDVPCSGDSCQDEDAVQGSTYPRTLYHPLFDQYGVDLVLYGHAHNYVRTFPIKYDSSTPDSPIITSTNQNNYVNPDGQIFVQSGAGGRSLRDLTGTENYNVFQSDSEFGILNIDVVNTNSNNLQLIGKFIQNDGDVIDQFTITTQLTPQIETLCNDGIDNDGDGKKDAEDLDCPAVAEICNNGLDDDRDGFKDAEDVNSCPAVAEICNNGLDDDRDGLRDATDPDCQATTGYHYAPFFTATGSNKLDIPDSANLRLSSFTVATWFKTTTNFPEEGVMVNKGGLGSESTGANQNYGIWFTPSERLQGGFETTGGTNRYITSANTYNDGQWHHGVVTFDNTNNIVRLFVDGVQLGTLSTTSNPDNTGSQPLRIAGNAQSLTEDFFVGQLDEVGVWNRALSSAEIINLMEGGVFTPNGLVYSNSFNT